MAEKFKFAEAVVEMSYQDAGLARGLDSIEQRLSGLVAKGLSVKQSLNGMLDGLQSAMAGNGLSAIVSSVPAAAGFAAALTSVADAYIKISGAAEEAARAEHQRAMAVEASAKAQKTALDVYQEQLKLFKEDQDNALHAGAGGVPRTRFDNLIELGERLKDEQAAAANRVENAPRDTGVSWNPLTWWRLLDPMAGVQEKVQAQENAWHQQRAAEEGLAAAKDKQARARAEVQPNPADRPMDLRDREMNQLEAEQKMLEHERMTREAEATRIRREMNEAADINDRIMANDNGRLANIGSGGRQLPGSRMFGIDSLYNAIAQGANDPNAADQKRLMEEQKQATKQIDTRLQETNGLLRNLPRGAILS